MTAKPPAGPVSVSSEPVMTCIPTLQRKKGFLGLGVESFVLLATSTRLVFVHIDKQTMNAFVQEARESAKAEGKGLLGQAAAQMGWVGLMVERLQALGPDGAIVKYPGSFIIPNQAVRRVRVRRSHANEDGFEQAITLELRTTSGKHRFMVPQTSRISQKEVRQRLQQTLGAIVR